MLKRKPSFATFWLPIAAVSFAHLMFPGIASAQQPKVEQIAPNAANVPSSVPDAPAALNDDAGYLSLDQLKNIPGLDISSEGSQLVIHGLIPQECSNDISIVNTNSDTTIKSGGVGGIAIKNNGGALKCITDHGSCKTGTSAAGACEKLSSRSDAKMTLKDASRSYDYLNVDQYADSVTNAHAAGLHLWTATSSADSKSSIQSAIESNFQSCVTAGKLNEANTILNGNMAILGQAANGFKDQLDAAQKVADDKAAAAEKKATAKAADTLAKKIADSADKDDFDYKDANGQITAFLDEHPEQGDKFAQLIIDLAGAHTKDGNPTASDVAEAKEALEAALNTDYTYKDKNRKNLEVALNQGIPRAEDRVTFMKDAELAQRGNPTALMKFEQSYAKKIAKLSSDYNKKCVSSDKANAQTCEDMATELADMEQMPQQVMAQAQQNNVVQQQAMASIFSPNQGSMGNQMGQMGMMGMQQQQNPMCMYNPTACMQITNPYMASNPYAQVGGYNIAGNNGMIGANSGQAFAPQQFANTGGMALQGTMVPSMQQSSMYTLGAGYNGIPTVNNAYNTNGLYLSH